MLVFVCACGPNRRTVRTWIEGDMECRDVVITHLTYYYFEAEGCERQLVYHCPNRQACERSTRREGGAETAENLDQPN